MKALLAQFWRDETGASAVEYALIVAIVGIAIVAATRAVGLQISAVFGAITEAMAVR